MNIEEIAQVIFEEANSGSAQMEYFNEVSLRSNHQLDVTGVRGALAQYRQTREGLEAVAVLVSKCPTGFTIFEGNAGLGTVNNLIAELIKLIEAEMVDRAAKQLLIIAEAEIQQFRAVD